jgi:hypothetical protein
MSGTSLALKFGSLILGAGVIMILYKTVKGVQKYGLATFVYLILASLILSLSVIQLLIPVETEILLLIFTQAFIVFIGILHVVAADKKLPWHQTQAFEIQLLFAVCILLFAYFISDLFFAFFVSSYMKFIWNLSLLWFLVPFLLNKAVDKLIEVPPKEYKKWRYPANQTVEDPSDGELENPIVISFVFNKNPQTRDLTTFRAKAPIGMSLGKLFYFFINDYNSRYPDSGISYANDYNESDEWVFFRIKNKLFHLKEALDPDELIYGSDIRENDILLCKRIVTNKKTLKNETVKQ